jgi:hypothetical protein
LNEEQEIVYVRGIMLQAEIRMNGMIAANQQRAAEGAAPAYVEKDFVALIEEFGVHHNALISNLCRR